MADTAETSQTPFAQIGGRPAVDAIVARFYALMDRDPAYAELRAMHADDLGPVREGLASFLTGWLGGPRDWFDDPSKGCVMSLHRSLAITPALSLQWLEAMARAIAGQPGLDQDFSAEIAGALARMARMMINRRPEDVPA